MRNTILAAVITAGLVSPAAVAADGAVIVATSTAPFVAGHTDIVRVAPPAAGSPPTPRLAGPARLVTFAVRNSTDAAATPSRVEYDVVPTGKGKVTLEFLAAPAGKKTPAAVVARYEFEVR